MRLLRPTPGVWARIGPCSPIRMGDPATRAKKMTDRMTQQLGLDQATSQKVYDVTLSRAQKVDAIQASSDDNRG